MFGKKIFFYCVLLIGVLTGCAKRGTITGGLKDTLAPVLRSSIPKNFSTEFKGNTIRLTFDEYVKLKNVNKQLIISPPMKTAPEITPSTSSQYINIKIKDTLEPNTTYSFNFGQSIEDNNEGIPFRQFKYVFSTGSYIDSLSLSGTIKDAYALKTDNFVTVALYEINEKFNDSTIYKETPRYITNTLDSATTFKLENLKAGKYLLVALKDLNNNYKYNPATEKIGFHKEYVTIPNDTLHEIELFKETPVFKSLKPFQSSGNRISFGYEGKAKNTVIESRKGGNVINTIVTKMPKKDTLQVWFPSFKADDGTKTDSVSVIVKNGSYSKEWSVKIKNQKIDTLSFSPNYNLNLPLAENFAITSSVPLTRFDKEKINLVNKDSASVEFTTVYDTLNQKLTVNFQKEPLEKYKMTFLPGALNTYLQQQNDTLVYRLETKNTSEVGNLRLTLENVRQYPVIVQLTDSKGEVIYSRYVDSSPEVEFNLLEPAKFTLRVIYDENKNGEWDSGSFPERRQGEETIYFPKEVDVRANWDVIESFNLSR